jgi:peptidoglycan/LPS O-acetylase OafA/YrhL
MLLFFTSIFIAMIAGACAAVYSQQGRTKSAILSAAISVGSLLSVVVLDVAPLREAPEVVQQRAPGLTDFNADGAQH